MRIFIFLKATVLNVLWIVLACFVHDAANAQEEILTKENGGVSWQTLTGKGANVRAVRASSNQTISSGLNTTVTFDDEEHDINNTFDHSTGVFTPPHAGYYVIKASVNCSGGATGVRSVRLVKNGSTIMEQGDEKGSGNMHLSIHTVIYSDGSDNYRIEVLQNSGSNLSILGSSSSGRTEFIAFNLLSSPVKLKKQNGGLSWSSSEGRTSVRATRTSTQTITNTTVTFDSEEYDVNSTFNHTTGVFTPPQAGYYVILASVGWADNGVSSNRSIRLWRTVSGQLPSIIEYNSENGDGAMNSSMHTVIESDGSDNYRIGAFQNSGGSQNINRASFVAFRIGDLSQDETVVKLNGGVSIRNIGGASTIVKAKITSTLTVPSGVNHRLGYSSEDFDINGEFNHSTGIFSPTEKGYYVIMATVNWDGGSNSSSGLRGVRLTKWTTPPPPASPAGFIRNLNFESGSGGSMTSSLHTVVYYNGTSGHVFRVEAYQDSGSDHDIDPSGTAPGAIFIAYKL